jgi:hypothetical protein
MRFFLPKLLALTTLMFSVSIYAQEKSTDHKHKCGTMLAIEENKRQNPKAWEELERKQNQFLRTNPTARTAALNSPVTIPVVVHVVHPTPNIVTEEQVDYLLNRLNLDFSGDNSDSTNATSFYSIRGRSQIRFTRARRDPMGNLTNGLEKRVGTVGVYGTTYQRIKHSNLGGLDPWDITRYYNIWVGVDSSGQGLLGIAPGIGPGYGTEFPSSTTGIDGVCVVADFFSNACYSPASNNLARTVVHEIGHNFGLYHTFSGCAVGADFDQLTTGHFLPASLLAAADDTPSQNQPTSGCPTGPLTSCSQNRNWQNYMDYTDDPCMTMFTKGQVARMEYVLEFFRSGYLTSNGAVPPPSVPLVDAGVDVIVSPGGNEFNNTTCALTTYPMPSCAGTFIPRLSIKNFGSSAITSVVVNLNVNGNITSHTFNSLNVLTFLTTTLVFPSATLVNGSNTVSYTITQTNGSADANTSNNTISQIINIGGAETSLSENFVGTNFPPAGFTVLQLAGTGNWARANVGKNTTGSAKFDNYNYVANTASALTSGPIQIVGYATSASLQFHYAHASYSTTPEPDRLDVQISTNCGATWETLWTRTGSQLRTVTSAVTSPFTPSASQWTATPIVIDLNSYIGQVVQFRFRAISGYGNNLYLDDVTLATTPLPLQFVSFTAKLQNNKGLLEWRTANELNCDYFDIEKSTNGRNFTAIGRVEAKNAASNGYTFIDEQLSNGTNYYRLLQVDKDGKSTYSTTVTLNTNKQNAEVFTVYPNPVKQQATVNITSNTEQRVTLQVYNTLGKIVYSKSVQLFSGNQSINLDMKQLPAGVYSISLIGNDRVITQKLIKE